MAEITRLGQTLMHVPALHWIVADDVNACNKILTNLLKKFGKIFYLLNNYKNASEKALPHENKGFH